MVKYSFSDIQDKRREHRRPKPKVRTKINPVSKNLKEDQKIYSVLRKDFLKDHPNCEAGLENCTHEATTIHHKLSRGKLLNVTEFWIAVCMHCHDFIERHPKVAKELGLSLSRLKC